MPSVSHRGQRIQYDIEGAGPTVVLQHGLLSSRFGWRAAGYVDSLKDRYRVITVDSLGHGGSDKPADKTLYTGRQRAGDLMAVLDDLSVEKVHLVGYSMGGWLAAAVALHYPGRIASLAIGGWDITDGATTFLPTELQANPPSVEWLLAAARQTAPQLIDWVTPDVEPALDGCWRALFQVEGMGAAIDALQCPVMLWCGTEDRYYPAMKAFAKRGKRPFLSLDQDHMGAMFVDAPKVAEALATHFSGL